MVLPFYSRQQYKYEFTHMCSECGKLSWSLKFIKGDGTNISHGEVQKIALSTMLKSLGTIFTEQSRDDIRAEALSILAQCPKCEKTWPVFSGAAAPRSQRESQVEVIETHRSQEEFGTEQRRIDNSKSIIELERRLTIIKEWSKSVVMEREDAQKAGVELNIGVNEAASIKAAAEKAIKSKYTVSENTKETYEDSLLLKVPSKTNLLLVLNWKRIWQHGIIRIFDQDGTVHEVPFKTVVGVSFDQTQVDEP